MALGIPIFRIRSPLRDHERDMERFRLVQSAIEKALESASRELAGLEKRVFDAQSSAISLMDNSGDYGRRDPEDEQQVAEFEATAKAAQKRLEDLQLQCAHYEKLRQQASELRPKEHS